MQEREYRRILLKVEAVFETDGSFTPKKIICDNGTYDIIKIKGVRRYCPNVVRCIAPIEYTVRIEDQERKIYFEPDSNSWFSVKEVIAQ